MHISRGRLVIDLLLELSPGDQFSTHAAVGLGRQNPLEEVVKSSPYTHGSFYVVTLWTVAHQAPLSMGILWAQILEWVAMPSSRESSQLKD